MIGFFFCVFLYLNKLLFYVVSYSWLLWIKLQTTAPSRNVEMQLLAYDFVHFSATFAVPVTRKNFSI